MIRVMLVLEDYNEILYLQTLLKKIGLDVLAVNNQKKYFDASLGFSPNVVVASAKQKNVDAIALGWQLKAQGNMQLKLIALRGLNVSITEEEVSSAGIDSVIDSPVNIKKFVTVISELCQVSPQKYIEKLDRLSSTDESGQEDGGARYSSEDDQNNIIKVKGYEEQEEIVEVKGGSSEKRISKYGNIGDKEKEKRAERLNAYLKNMDKPKGQFFSRDTIIKENKKIRKSESKESLAADAERKKFVDALFKNKE